MALLFHVPAYAVDTGEMPVPVFTDAGIEAVANYDAADGLFTYSYTISNPATNTGKLLIFDIDIRRPRHGMELSSAGLTIPYETRTYTFDEEISSRKNPPPMVPVGMRIPSGSWWTGGITYTGTANFWGGKSSMLPGQTQGGFELYSRGLPGIRDVEIEPAWTYVGEATYEATRIAIEIEEQLKVRKKTIGPTAPPGDASLNFLALQERIVGYIDESITLSWLTDTTLANSLRAKLTAARQFMDADDGTQAKAALGEFMTLLDNSSAAQRTNEAYGLLYFNAKYLKDRLPDTAIPIVHIFLLDLLPVEAEKILGTPHALTATVTVDGEPMYCMPVRLEIISGPNAGLFLPEGLPGFPVCTPPDWAPTNLNLLFTDANGQSVFSYTGRLLGTDKVVAHVYGEAGPWFSSETVDVNWSGGPDLAIKLFSPPMIIAKGGAEISVTESTANMGNVAAGPSVTRYYLSEDETIDPATDRVIGERQIESLEPGMDSDGGEQTFIMPSDLAEGTYYMWGCADADEAVTETYELNNCLKNQVVTQIAIPIQRPTNQPPDCSQAFPGIASLWPPNHKTVKTGIVGV
ncbi:MAG: CARDB domain-containing protein, partial [Nitrospinales bacterium]